MIVLKNYIESEAEKLAANKAAIDKVVAEQYNGDIYAYVRKLVDDYDLVDNLYKNAQAVAKNVSELVGDIAKQFDCGEREDTIVVMDKPQHTCADCVHRRTAECPMYHLASNPFDMAQDRTSGNGFCHLLTVKHDDSDEDDWFDIDIPNK